MKKTIVLLTIVLAFVAAPVFAETTSAFSGEVEYAFGSDFSDYKEDLDSIGKISLTGQVGEFTTITLSYEMEADSDGSGDTTNDAWLNTTNLILTQDVTGALGVDGPISFAYALGKQDFEVADYSAVAGYGDFEADAETNSALGLKMTIGATEMFNADVVVYPKSYYDGKEEFALNAYGTVSMIDYSAYVVMNNAYDVSDLNDDFPSITTDMIFYGVNVGAVIDALSVGVLFEGVSVEEESLGKFGVAGKYQVTEEFSAGLAFGTKFTSVDTGKDFSDYSAIGINVNYDFSEAFGVWAAAILNNLNFDNDFYDDIFGYELGAKAMLDGVTYSAGWTYKSDYQAFDASSMCPDGNIFFKVAASF